MFWNKSTDDYEQLDYYSTINELPITIWFEIHQGGDYRKLLKEKVEISTKQFLWLSTIWQKIYDEYMEEFGLSEDYVRSLEESVVIAKLQADYIITKEKYLKTLINIEKEEIKRESSGVNKPIGLETILAKMSKYYGFKLSSRELTTAEYYSYIHNITDGR